MKLVYIAGSGRSGSTLLARILGEIDGCINIGEALRWWYDLERMGRSRPCACGRMVDECSFWKDFSELVPESVQVFATKYIRIRYIPFIALMKNTSWFRDEWTQYLNSVKRFLYHIQKKTKKDVIIDSSKNAANLFAVMQIPEINPYVIHLVRDSRAVVSSWTKPKADLKGYPVYKPISWWISYNLSVDMLKPKLHHYYRLRYEDFVREPAEYLKEIAAFLDLNHQIEDLEKRIREEKKVYLSINHMLGSNPDREQSGDIEIRPRKYTLSTFYWFLTTMFTIPMLIKYRYSIIDNN